METQLCRYFRAKTMYVAGKEQLQLAPAPNAEPLAGHCWCNKTMAPVGVDDQLVSSVRCREGERACFENR